MNMNTRMTTSMRIRTSMTMRKKKEDQPPQSLGIPYFREER